MSLANWSGLLADWARPEHAHAGMTGEMARANDGQEEVYFGLEGSAALRVDGQEIPIQQGVIVRCGPSQMRQRLTHDSSARVLAIGGVPVAPIRHRSARNSRRAPTSPIRG